MIDWFGVAANALWIAGCALGLAAFSYASWEASLRREKLLARLNQPGAQFVFNLAGLLFCAHLAATVDVGWEIVLWLLLAVLFLVQGIWIVVRRK